MLLFDSMKLIIERANQQLTIRELASKAGVRHSTISDIENGHVKPRPITMAKIAKALGKDLEFFRKDDA